MDPVRPPAGPHPGHRWPVVVAGAGPAGLVTAITLARYDIPVLVLNRRTSVSTLPRATVLSVRTMELMRSWGLEAAVRSGGHEVEWRMLASPTLSRAGEGQPIEVGFPTRAEGLRVSPTWPACVPQDHFETVLLEHLRSLPSAHVVTGLAVEDLQPDAGGFRLALRDTSSGAPSGIEARYVVGADGARSIVRQRLGIGATETDRLQESITVVFHAPLWEVVGPHRYGIYVVDQPDPGTLLPAGHPDRWVYGFTWDPAVERLSDYSDDRLATRIRQAAGVPDLPVRITRVGGFAFTAAMAHQFREGDAFLVGDAAHRVTPRGGTGLNTAVAGALNLGWKLGWVLKGWAADDLLDTYESERRPIAEHNFTRSLDPMGSRRPVRDELAVDLGGRIEHRWVTTPTGRRSTLDLVSSGLTRFTGKRHDGAGDPAPGGLAAPLATHRLDRRSAAALGADRPGGVLVRPDGVVLDPPTAAAISGLGRRPVLSRSG